MTVFLCCQSWQELHLKSALTLGDLVSWMKYRSFSGIAWWYSTRPGVSFAYPENSFLIVNSMLQVWVSKGYLLWCWWLLWHVQPTRFFWVHNSKECATNQAMSNVHIHSTVWSLRNWRRCSEPLNRRMFSRLGGGLTKLVVLSDWLNLLLKPGQVCGEILFWVSYHIPLVPSHFIILLHW